MTPTDKINVFLHDFDEKNNCLADVTLCDTSVVINDFKVMPGLGGGVMVHMPGWMHTRWSYTEVQWSEVRQIVTREYQAAIAKRKQLGITQAPPEKPQVCTFYPSIVKADVDVTATIFATGEKIEGIHLAHTKRKNILQVFMPRSMNRCWNISSIAWDQMVEIVTTEYKRQILGEPCGLDTDTSTVKIEFGRIQESTACMVDVKLPHKKSVIEGFRIKQIQGNEKAIITTPKWMRYWNDSRVSWFDLCDLITSEYKEHTGAAEQPAASPQPPVETPVLREEPLPAQPIEADTVERTPKAPTKEKDELGRIKNAENSSFIFYPRTVLRAEETLDNDSGDSRKNNLFTLVSALNKGSLGGIGPFEINILEWIAKLRYVTSTMLIDLIKAGYVSFGWRSEVTQAKLSKIINRMSNYGLITLTRFVTVKDDGSIDGSNRSAMRILTLGKNGSVLLHELGKSTQKYNAFDIFQDGNTVKRYLTTNQWLIYWLKTYKEEIGEDYETSCLINRKGEEYIGARIYATVTVNDCTMAAEPIRRVEDFEVESRKQQLREKVQRLSSLFDNLDQLYHGKDEISFPQRPILVLLCEDDDHIFEVEEAIRPILPELGEQEIWFSSDLRVFNYNKRGERFLHVIDGSLQPIDLKQVIGIDNEAELPDDTADDDEQND